MPATKDNRTIHVLIAQLGAVRIGFPAECVELITRAVYIQPVAGALPILEGIINVRGTPTPVIDIRARLGLPPVPLAPSQVLVLLKAGTRAVAARVDEAEEVVEIAANEVEEPESVSAGIRRVAGIAPYADGTLVIYDVDTFLTAAEQDAIEALVKAEGGVT